MKVEVSDVPIEPEVKEILDDHSGRLGKLETDSEVFKEKFNNITTQLTRIENASLSSNNALLASNNSVLQTLQKVVGDDTIKNTNNAEVLKIKSNNFKEIAIKVLAILGFITVGYFALKGVNIKV